MPADKNNPYHAEILTVQKLTGRGSQKNTFHLELAIDPAIIQYRPGDSLGVLAHSSLEHIESLLRHWQLIGDELFTFKKQSAPIKDLLENQVEITQISKPFIKFMAEQLNDKKLTEMADSHEAFNAYAADHQLIDLLHEFDPEQKLVPQDCLNQLRAVTPRLYSIASAQSVFEDEVHLTINLEDPTPSGHLGLASGLLCHSLSVGDDIKVFVEPNQHFKLPENPDTPIILIGPGTGVAPFRSFLQERAENKASGENWLIFGNPKFETDFLYQTEWLKLQQQGVLNHIDVAFSRDQAHKIYVQHKLKQKSKEVWQWLQNGASLYLCGDATRMAKDVESSLIEIIAEQQAVSVEQASKYLKTLKREHRFQKDVY